MRCLLIAGLLFIWSETIAQVFPAHNNFEYLTIPGSIRSGNINEIVQDSEGIMWFATSGGLYKYNGNNFTQYRYLSADSVKLEGKSIISLHWDSIGKRLLIGTIDLGLLSYDYASDSIKHLVKSNLPIRDIQQTSDGLIWIQSHTDALTRFENNQLKKIKLTQGIIYNPSTIVANDTDLFVGDIFKIFRVQGNEIKQTYEFGTQGVKQYPNSRYTTLFIHKNQLWAGTEKQGVLVFDVKSGKLLHHFEPTNRPFYSRINSIVENNGKIWCLTKAEGIAVISPETWKWEHYSSDDGGVGVLGGNNCFSGYTDQTGMLWLGINSDITIYDPSRFYFDHLRHFDQDKESISDNMIRSVWVDENNNIYTGTDGGFINIINSKTNKSIYISVSSNKVIVPFSFLRKGPGEIFVGTNEGLYVFNESTRKLTEFEPLQKVFHGKRVRQILQSNDILYFLTAGVVVSYHLKTGKISGYDNFEANRKGTGYTIHVDTSGRLWVGTSKPSLARLNEDGSFIEYNLSSDTSRHVVLTIAEHTPGTFYTGCQNGGIHIGTISNTGHYIARSHITTKNGLPDNTVYALLPDRQGNFWVSTNQGLCRINPKDSSYLAFDKTYGLQENEFNRLAYAQMSDGRLLFGGINGLNIVEPAKFTPDNFLPVPKIFTLTFNNQEGTELNLIGKEDLDFNHRQNYFTIEFGSSDYRSNRPYQFYYRLKGMDKNWIPSNGSNLARYTALAAGKYTFQVKIVNSRGQSSEISLNFVIHPPFYQTWYFITGTILVVIILGIGLIQGRIQQNRMDKERLENLLRLRTAEIEESRHDLQILNQKKDLIFSILSHDLRSPLTTLKGFLSLLISDQHKFTPEEISKYAVTIRNSVSTSLDLIDNTLYWSLSQMGSISVKPVVLNLKTIFDRIQELYQPTADKKQIKLHFEASPEAQIVGDENMLLVIIRNLVSNAIKFTKEEKSIRVKALRVGNQVEVTITDEGVGIAADHLEHLMNKEQPIIMRGTQQEKGTGLGLLLVKNFIKDNKGTLSISSMEGIGTVVTIIFPAYES